MCLQACLILLCFTLLHLADIVYGFFFPHKWKALLAWHDYWCHFSDICSLCVSVSHFGNSPNTANLFINTERFHSLYQVTPAVWQYPFPGFFSLLSGVPYFLILYDHNKITYSPGCLSGLEWGGIRGRSGIWLQKYRRSLFLSWLCWDFRSLLGLPHTTQPHLTPPGLGAC